MKNILSKITLTLVLASTLPLQIAHADFSDVSASHRNVIAIEFLQEQGIIEGYSDGTFRPGSNINRAEFLKLIMEGSDLTLDQNDNTPFGDVDHQSWYAPYVKKAYHEGWVEGYVSDNTFRPGQDISKAEALKIIAMVQGWEFPSYTEFTYFDDVFRSMWFAPYISYAYEANYLEDISNNYSPNTPATRAYISELIYRSYISPEALAEHLEIFDPYGQTSGPTVPGTDSDLNPIETGSEVIATDFFDGIELDAPIPRTFYPNEVYVIEGEITDDLLYNSATILLEKNANEPLLDFMDSVQNQRFAIPVFFSEPGEYKIGLLKGESGTSKAQTVTVVNQAPTTSNNENSGSAPSNTNVNFVDGDTIFEYSAANNQMKRLTLLQGSRSQIYYSRQNLDYIPVRYSDFANWNTNSVTYSIASAPIDSQSPPNLTATYLSSNNRTFNPTLHGYSYNDITYTPQSLPERVAANANITISGTISVAFDREAFYIAPDGSVNLVDLEVASDRIQADGYTVSGGSEFTLNFNPETSGNYQFEVNDTGGIAVINHTVYVGNIIPLLPNFYDLNPREFPTSNPDLSTGRNQMLNLINNYRAQFDLDPVTLDSDLNQLAQNHSNDMAANNYFAHVNLEGQTPNDRRLEAGIPTIVGENLVKDVSIEFGHYGLINSAIHRQNILNPEWERVGIGIAVDSQGYSVITQHFSTNPLTNQTLADNELEAIAAINQLRADENLSVLIRAQELDQTGQYISNSYLNENQALNNDLLSEAIDENNIQGLTQALLRTHFSWQSILDSLLIDEEIVNPNWQNIGIDIQLDENGNRFTILLLNRQ